MSDLIFYGVKDGRTVIGPFHPDEISARARTVHTLNKGGRPVYMIHADTYEQACRKLAKVK